MLTELKVSQFAIIDHVHIQFNHGLNILSGETGAGKSILIKSLALLMGAKSSNQDIRSQKERALIEGAFDLSQRPDILERLQSMGIENDDQELIVRRVLQKNGKSKVYLNGHLSSLSDLRHIVSPLVTLSNPSEAPLIEMTGQHENKDLVSHRYQMELLDQFCGNQKLRSQVEDHFNELQNLQKQIEELESLSHQREQQMDFLRFQINEIENISPTSGEDEDLKKRIGDLKEQDRWQQWLQQSIFSLSESDSSILSQIQRVLNTAPAHSQIKSLSTQLEDAHTLLEDVAYELQRLSQQESEESLNLEELEERLSKIRKLQKKFGMGADDINLALKDMKDKYAQLNGLSESVEEQKNKIKEVTKQLQELCTKLHKKRRQGARLLSEEVNRELLDLNMKGLRFVIEVKKLESPQSTGSDQVRFQSQVGHQDPARDIAKVASGGELSRLLLALKQVIGASHHPRTFLFDEVDTGVSGPTAEKVGAKLKNLAQAQQVICVTHLPQVASFADHHYFIEKKTHTDGVEMAVTPLKPKDRVTEIARLISGEKTTKASLVHAKALLDQSSSI